MTPKYKTVTIIVRASAMFQVFVYKSQDELEKKSVQDIDLGNRFW